MDNFDCIRQKADQKAGLEGQPFFNRNFDFKSCFFLSTNVLEMSFGCIILIRTDLHPSIGTICTVQDDRAAKTETKLSSDVTICFSVAYIHDD